MEYMLMPLKRYADFSGRSRRKEYWMFVLVNIVISVALGFVEGRFGLVSELGIGMISLVYTCALLVPSIAVGVRRLHDTGRSGWWLLIALVPLVGAIALIVFAAQDSEAGHNEYGPNPKSAPA